MTEPLDARHEVIETGHIVEYHGQEFVVVEIRWRRRFQALSVMEIELQPVDGGTEVVLHSKSPIFLNINREEPDQALRRVCE